MSTQKDDLTAQVDGLTDTFTTLFPYASGSLMLGYNGQVYPPGINIAEEIDAQTFRLTFTPDLADTSVLFVVYEDYGTLGENEMQGGGLPPGF